MEISISSLGDYRYFHSAGAGYNRAIYETPARIALPLLARLKLTLLRRHFQRNALGGVGTALVVLAFTGALTVAALSFSFAARAGGPDMRDSVMLWSAWILSFILVNAPLSQFDTQRSLDLSALRLLPLSAGTFTRAVLLDALLSPQGVFTLLPTLVLIGGLSLNLLELPLVAFSFALLFFANIAFGQALFLSLSRLISSRRFADISIVVGMVLVFAFQGVNLLLHTSARQLGLPHWAVDALHSAKSILGPAAAWLYPSLSAGVVRATTGGQPLLAALKATALVGQCVVGFWLAGRATRAFYEGELESGGRRGTRGAARASAGIGVRPFHLLAGALGALYNRERIYLWRDPLLKSLFLQSVLSVAYFSAVSVWVTLGATDKPLFPPRYLLLGIAMLLTFSESYLLFNKLGLEGQELTATLLAPVSRARILRAKSIFFLTHFLALNMLIVTGLGVALRVEPLFICAALALLASSACIVDVAGHFVSLWFPHAYRRHGRHFRPQYAQTGCGYMLVYGLTTQACNLAVLPTGAAIVLGALLGGWSGLALGSVIAAGVSWAAYYFGLPLAAQQLESREPEIIEAVTRRGE